MIFFFFNDTATTEIYTLSLHDALPISNVDYVLHPKDTLQLAYSVLTENQKKRFEMEDELDFSFGIQNLARFRGDRKSTRLNSSHANISYAVFCLKKKKKLKLHQTSKTK